MGKVTSLQPILRFSGFNGDWSKKWLGVFAQLAMLITGCLKQSLRVYPT